MILVAGAVGGGIVGGWIAVLSWRRREQPAAKSFTVFVLSQSAWSLAAAVLWVSEPFWVSKVGLVMTNVFAVAAVASWVVFTTQYTGFDRLVRGTRGRLLAVFAGVLVALMVTNPWHQRYLTDLRPATYDGLTLVAYDYTPLFVGTTVVVYLVVCWSYWLMVKFYRTARAGERRQTAVILLANAFYVAVTIVYFVGGVSVHPALNPSPVFFPVTVALIAYALFYDDFLDVTPMTTDLLLAELRDPVVVLGPEGAVLECNDAAAALVPERDIALTETAPSLARAIEAEAKTVTLTRDGEDRTYDVSVSPVYDHHERRRGRLVVLRDITVQRRKQERLEQQNERLEAFTEVVSHDLRNPLSVAVGNAELALETEEIERVEEVVAALEDMDSLIDDLLELAREGETINEREQVCLEEAVRDAWTQVETGEAELRVDCDGTVVADGRRFSELLGNLYRNSVEHVGGDVTVTVGLLENGDGMYIEDDGPGIPADRRDEVFESGVSTDGTGLGLSIVETIADAHGWSVRVTDGEDGGARFELTDMEIAPGVCA